MHMYTDLAEWWPLLSLPADYAEEAVSFREWLAPLGAESPSLLELGSGGGNLASHFKAFCRPTLTDLSAEMLAVSRALNPELEHIQGDMRGLRLGRAFDAVLLHDAVMYMSTEADLRAALTTAAVHCRPGGRVIIAPDCVRETFEPSTECGGHDAADGRGLRYVEWCWDPDPTDSSFEVAYALITRTQAGDTKVALDRHHEGLFGRAEWLAWLADAGFAVQAVRDPWRADVFLGERLPQ